jgi:serine/threonine protein kinase
MPLAARPHQRLSRACPIHPIELNYRRLSSMQLRLGTPHAQHAPARRRLSAPVAAAPRVQARPWRLTRRLPTAGKLELFRASAANELGPGCYVLKTTAIADDAIALAMLHREHVVSSDVSHPNLNSVLAADFHARKPVLILPYLEGISLRHLIASRASAPNLVPAPYALMLARQLAEALAAMHAAGWLHSQVRPEHVIVSPHAHATLIDLTLARRLDSHECDCGGAQDNRAATYEVPESFSSRRRLTTAADIYSLGIVLFELLTGQPPFSASSLRQLAICHQRQAPPDLRQIHLGLPHDVAHLVRRMLAKEPLRRPSDEQLIRWLTELEIQALA